MKPLPAAPLTSEDLDTWGWVQSKRRAHLWHLAAHGDRRDAELMLQGMRMGAVYLWAPSYPGEVGPLAASEGEFAWIADIT